MIAHPDSDIEKKRFFAGRGSSAQDRKPRKTGVTVLSPVRTSMCRHISAVAVLFCVTTLEAAFASQDKERPNVILILADDLAIGDLSCFNDGLSRTPHLDDLLRESVYFESAYSGSPVCAPSRASLLTGRYPHRTGSVTLNQIKFPELTRLRRSETTVADRFSANGYVTGLVGKWHSGPGDGYHALQRGFHEFVGFNDSTDVKTYFQYQLDVQGEYRRFEGSYLTDVLTARAIEFVQRHRDKSFFLHLAHYAPHRPLSAPATLIQRYLQQGLPEKTATVYSMIEVMDAGIGELVDELDRLGIADRTIVIFASDNGPDPLVGERFNGDNRGTKYMVNEGGIHVPLMVRWKGQITPGRRTEVVHFTDLVPTLIEVCRLNRGAPGKPIDGQSIAGLLSERFSQPDLPQYRFWQWNRAQPLYSHNAAVREDHWKLVRPYVTRNIPDRDSTAQPRLYNLSNDPRELHDMSDSRPDIRDRLVRQLKRWSEDVERDRVHAVAFP